MSGSLSRQCMHCQSPLKGRADKKFCDDYCRSVYNNNQKDRVNPIVRNLNNRLMKNRKILSRLFEENNLSANRNQLFYNGFDFRYHTHISTQRSGITTFYCYEYGYRIEKGKIIILKNKV